MNTVKNIGLRGSRVAGMTLVELMVALAIGSFLMIGAVTVFMQSRATFRMNEAVSRLQENARFVIDAIEPDIRMANYFGLTSRSFKVDGRATPAVGPVYAVAGDCTNNWSVNLISEVDGTNNGYTWAGCAAFGAAVATADTLVVRRVAEDPDVLPLAANTLYVQSARYQNSQIFVATGAPGSGVPTGYPVGQSQSHRLVANGYYVSQNSSLDTPGNPVPSLRMKTLSGLTVIDQEVLPGVEDMQVQFGIDTDVVGGIGRGAINRYVNPGDPILNPALNPDTEVLAVRIWLRVRAERPDVSYTDTALYNYANLPAMVMPFGDGFRRVVVSKTIYLRNARPPT